MATNVIMPALEMAQETGKVLRWLKAEGDTVKKGEPIMEIETDKVTVEIESPASGILQNVTAREGDSVPVGQTIALVLGPGEAAPPRSAAFQQSGSQARASASVPQPGSTAPTLQASPVAARIAAEHNVDLSQIKPRGSRIEKADVMAYLTPTPHPPSPSPELNFVQERGRGAGVADPAISSGGEGVGHPASPKARRLASERGIDLATLHGSGPDGAILAADVPSNGVGQKPVSASAETLAQPGDGSVQVDEIETPGTVWRVMAERMVTSWTTTPHFYLVRDVDATNLVEMRSRLAPIIEKKSQVKLTYTDLLVKLIAVVLRDHPRVNARWAEKGIQRNAEINIGVATAMEEGLIVPVIHQADRLSLGELAAQRLDLGERARSGKLTPSDIAGGTFTLTNLGMYNVDAFNAIINAPQAAILATGRIADRVVPVNGQPAVRPMITLTLGCDHRVVDGARAAQFLDGLAKLIEEPWGLLA